jgi:hypothetical protein
MAHTNILNKITIACDRENCEIAGAYCENGMVVITARIKLPASGNVYHIFTIDRKYAPPGYIYGKYISTNTGGDYGKVTFAVIESTGEAKVYINADILRLEPIQFIYPLKR